MSVLRAECRGAGVDAVSTAFGVPLSLLCSPEEHWISGDAQDACRGLCGCRIELVRRRLLRSGQQVQRPRYECRRTSVGPVQRAPLRPALGLRLRLSRVLRLLSSCCCSSRAVLRRAALLCTRDLCASACAVLRLCRVASIRVLCCSLRSRVLRVFVCVCVRVRTRHSALDY